MGLIDAVKDIGKGALNFTKKVVVKAAPVAGMVAGSTFAGPIGGVVGGVIGNEAGLLLSGDGNEVQEQNAIGVA